MRIIVVYVITTSSSTVIVYVHTYVCMYICISTKEDL